MMISVKYIRPKDKVEFTITQKGTLQNILDDASGGTNDFIVFMVEGGGKTYIPVSVAIAPGLLYIWKLDFKTQKDCEEIEDKLRKLFILQIKKTIKEDLEKLKMYFLFKANNFPEFANTFEKTIENFEKEIAK